MNIGFWMDLSKGDCDSIGPSTRGSSNTLTKPRPAPDAFIALKHDDDLWSDIGPLWWNLIISHILGHPCSDIRSYLYQNPLINSSNVMDFLTAFDEPSWKLTHTIPSCCCTFSVFLPTPSLDVGLGSTMTLPKKSRFAPTAPCLVSALDGAGSLASRSRWGPPAW